MMEAPTRLSCPACGKYFKVKKYNPKSRVSCPECKGPLVDPVGPTPKLFQESPGGGWEIPARLGRYKIGAEIARGGMGVVYKGEQEDLHRPIAIKMMLPHLAADAEHVHRFMREARAAAKLKHPNIVTIHEIGDYRNVPFFTMDFVDGKGLDDIANAGPVPLKRTAEIVRDTARAVHYAHSNGIIHRDIKPGNILIDKATGTPRITDFGLAKDLDARSMLSVTGEVLGTPSYMSPEQAQGLNKELDRRTDIYSLGVVLYRLLAGRVPFEGNTYADTIYKLVHHEVVDPTKLNKSVPSDLSAIVLRAMEKNPAERYATADELADDLQRYLSGEPVIATRPGAAKKLKRKLQKNKIATSIVAAVAAAAVLIVAVMYFVLKKSELDLIEANLKVPEMKLSAVGALMEGLADGRFDKEKARALKLANGALPAGADARTRDLVLGALERHPKLDGFRDTITSWMGEDAPRIMRIFAARKDREAVRAVTPYLKTGLPKETKLAALQFCQAVPDAAEYYGIGILMTDREVGEQARAAMQSQYVNKVVSIFSPAGASVGGALSELGSATAKHNKEIDDLLNPSGAPAGPKDSVEFAIVKLGSTDSRERLQAAVELGTHKDARGREPLLKALADSDAAVADVAGLSLGDIGLADAESKVSALLKDPRPSVRRAATIALGRAAAKSSKVALEEAFKIEKDERVKDALIDAMGRVR